MFYIPSKKHHTNKNFTVDNTHKVFFYKRLETKQQ